MKEFWQSMAFSANAIVPLIAMLAAGRWLLRSGQIKRDFVNQMNGLLYRYGIPGLLFFSIIGSEVSVFSQWRAIAAGYLATLGLFLGSTWVARRWIARPADRGVFVQGVFRGNLAIIGLALVSAVYGEGGLALGAVIAGTVALLLNILGVICLQTANPGRQSWKLLIGMIFRNPLVIGILLALSVRLLHFPVPEMVRRFGDIYTQITLPMALICIGASFHLQGIFGAGQMAIWASVGRLLVSPLCFLLMGVIFGLNGRDLGILCLLGAAPAATAGYVMAKAMGGNEVAAANIIAITTAASLLVVAPPIALFQMMGWI